MDCMWVVCRTFRGILVVLLDTGNGCQVWFVVLGGICKCWVCECVCILIFVCLCYSAGLFLRFLAYVHNCICYVGVFVCAGSMYYASYLVDMFAYSRMG